MPEPDPLHEAIRQRPGKNELTLSGRHDKPVSVKVTRDTGAVSRASSSARGSSPAPAARRRRSRWRSRSNVPRSR